MGGPPPWALVRIVAEQEPAAPDLPGPGTAGPGGLGTDEEIDQIVHHWNDLRHEAAAEEEQNEAERDEFLERFGRLVDTVVLPAMESVLARLRANGGGGRIEQDDEERLHRPRVTLWMSMDGEITGSPRQDRHPFMQLDADTPTRRVEVREGDMVNQQGASRAAAPWTLDEITPERVTERIIAILRRAGSHGVDA
jgi:hypothetical protein